MSFEDAVQKRFHSMIAIIGVAFVILMGATTTFVSAIPGKVDGLGLRQAEMYTTQQGIKEDVKEITAQVRKMPAVEQELKSVDRRLTMIESKR